MRAAWWIVVGLLIGSVVAVDGYGKLTESKVSCGYSTMERGDRCQEIGSTVKVRSYRDQRSSNQLEGLIETLIGSFVVLGSLGYSIVVIARVRELRRESS
ncbi:hypothetical protein [Nocardia lijiangensis]|uniref:hypothetical protein n=1 Tax=Nocardia lijiangensis TaxID=299618 RepID=UPI003D71F127